MAQPNGSDTRTAVVNALTGDPDGLTAREVSDKTGVSYSTAKEHLAKLRDEGLVVREQSGRQVTWALVVAETAPVAMPREVPVNVVADDMAVTRRNPSATGATVDGETPGPAGPVPVRHDPEPAETAVDELDPSRVTDVPAPAETPAGDDVAAVAAWMGQVRPMPEAPPEPVRPARAAVAVRDRDVKRDHKPGELVQRMKAWMGEHTDPFGTSQMANALNAHAGSVKYALDVLVKKGEVESLRVDGKPRYRVRQTADAS